MKQSGSWHFYPSDGLGSTMAVVDASGVVQDSYTYDVYGTPTRTGSLANEFDFAGQQTDGTGLQYLRARYYDPATGTFMSRDPLALYPGWLGSTHAYSGGEPVGSTDSSGLKPIDSDGTPLELTPNPPVSGGDEGGAVSICAGVGWEISDPGSIGISLPNGSWLTQKTIDGVRVDTYRICELTGEYSYTCSPEASGDTWRKLAIHNSDTLKKAEKIFELASSIYGTNEAARRAAREMGWKKAKVDWQGKAKNQDIFTDGKRFYSRDINSHSGGAWKVFDSTGKRIGTLDSSGKFIGK